MPKGDIRPTSERIREALFSSVADILPGARVLDLFAGSGVLGLEALSRGAHVVWWVEKNDRTVKFLRQSVRGMTRDVGAETRVVRADVGGFLGTGPYRDRREETLSAWQLSMEGLAACPNTFLKVGGIGMPMMGLRWDRQERPPTSEALAAPWRDPLRKVIDTFGPSRCMFESNYPVDMRGAGYVVLWNAFKRIAHGYSDAEKQDLFHDTAARAYRLSV